MGTSQEPPERACDRAPPGPASPLQADPMSEGPPRETPMGGGPGSSPHPAPGSAQLPPPGGGWGRALSAPQQGGAKPACLCTAHTCWSGGARPAGRTLSMTLITDGSRLPDHPLHRARTGLPGQGRFTRAQKRVRTGPLKAHTRMEGETEAGREEPGSEAMGRGSASRTEATRSML